MIPEEYYITLLTAAGRISEDRVTGGVGKKGRYGCAASGLGPVVCEYVGV